MARRPRAQQPGDGIESALRDLASSQTRLAEALEHLAEQQGELVRVQREQARQQAATNLIVRAQATKDPEAKARDLAEAARLLDSERRRARHRAAQPLNFPDRP